MKKYLKPALAAFLSLLGAGVGNFYSGHYKKFAFFMLANIFLYILTVTYFGRSFTTGALLAPLSAIVLMGLSCYYAFTDKLNNPGPELKYPLYTRIFIHVALIFVWTFIIAEVSLHFRRYQSYKVPGLYMEPELMQGDRVVADLDAYKSSNPEVGDIVMFEHPENQNIYFGKVSAKPGQSVMLLGELSTLYNSDYLITGVNKDIPEKSRVYGIIPRNFILGKALWVWLSFNDKNEVRPERVGLNL